MGALMDLIAGEEREILLAIAVDDSAGLAGPGPARRATCRSAAAWTRTARPVLRGRPRRDRRRPPVRLHRPRRELEADPADQAIGRAGGGLWITGHCE